MEVEFALREKVYLDTNLLLDYATVEEGGAFSPLERVLRSRNCERCISFLSEFEMLSVLRRKRFKRILWERVKTILSGLETKNIEISSPLTETVFNVIKRYTRILYNVVKNRLEPPASGIGEKVPERMDLYHYAIALHQGLDSVVSKDRQFCNKPTQNGIIETLRDVPTLKSVKCPRLKCVSFGPSEEEPRPTPISEDEARRIERELGLDVKR